MFWNYAGIIIIQHTNNLNEVKLDFYQRSLFEEKKKNMCYFTLIFFSIIMCL